MPEPRWLNRLIVDTIHSELIAEHGGMPGVRSGGEPLIESALARARNRFEYAPAADLFDFAAAYLFGFAKNHGYVDGNKRVAFAAAATFLLLNGRRLTATEPKAYDAVMGIVEDRHSEAEVAEWFRTHGEPAGDAG